MLTIGCHLSASKGYLHMGKTAVSIGANTFQFFTRNPRGGNAKALDLADIEQYLAYAQEHGINQILAHAPYTLNGASADPQIRDFAKRVMKEDLLRMEHLPGNCYNFHPGSHVKQGSERGIVLIADMLNEVLWPEQKSRVLLETMAGKGSEVGRSFEEIRSVIDRVELKEHLGVCLDTCHVWDGGYDIAEHLEEVLQEFDQVIGLERLYAIHLNDSKNVLASHKDRHERIGEGCIGLDAILRVVTHPRLSHLPFYLETPNELAGYEKEIKLIRDRSNEI